jgi:hypothetical protein
LQYGESAGRSLARRIRGGLPPLVSRLGARADDLTHVLDAYPTVGSDIPYMVWPRKKT